MSQTTFDTLSYYEKLTAAGVPDAQARAQADSLNQALKEYDQSKRNELATKRDLAEMELRLLKWQWGTGAAIFTGLAAIMARGFGWIGF